MKINKLKQISFTLALASVFAFSVPQSAFALNHSFLSVRDNGHIQIFGVEVTGISGNIINGIIRFKNSIVSNVVVNTTATTTIKTEGETSTSTLSNLMVGDIIRVKGDITSISNPITINADKIQEVTTKAHTKLEYGTVQSINTSNNTFVLKIKNNTNVTVQSTATTTYYLANKTNSNFASVVTLNSSLYVYGISNSDGSIITATKIIVKDDDKKEHKDEKVEKRGHRFINFGKAWGFHK